MRGAEAPLELSLERAQADAARLAPEVQIAEGHVRVARATRVGAEVRLPVNPRIALDARPALGPQERGQVGFASSLDLTFELGDVPAGRLYEAEARTDLARADAALTRLDARVRALAAYVGARLQARRMEHAREAIALGERVLAAANERSAAGAASDIDVASARAELAEARVELHSAAAERQLHEQDLRLLLGVPGEQPLHLTTSVEAPAPAPALDVLRARAHALRPALAAIEARLHLLTASDERLRREARPKMGAFVGVDASPASPLFGIAGLSIELTIAQRNQGPRAVVAAERQIELDRLHHIGRRVEVALRALREAFESRRLAVEVLTRDGIPAAEARLALVETGWRAGRFDVFRLTAAAQGLVRLKATRLQVLAQIWQERLLLERLIGGWVNEPS